MKMKKYTTIDAYFKDQAKSVQAMLGTLRGVIAKSAPGAMEVISYGMPAFKLNGRILVYFSAFQNHIGFFPTASGVSAFKKELAGYKTSKGTIQFPYDKPLPVGLVGKIVKFRVKETINKK